jgi:Rrf2 family protein
MKFSTKTRYGLRFMLHLAVNYGRDAIQLKEIAKSENISIKYLEQIILVLKTSGLLNVMRGAKGGYSLSKKPEEITLKEIVELLSGSLQPVDCVGDSQYCERREDCVMNDIWCELYSLINNFFANKTLKDLVDSFKEKSSNYMYYI